MKKDFDATNGRASYTAFTAGLVRLKKDTYHGIKLENNVAAWAHDGLEAAVFEVGGSRGVGSWGVMVGSLWSTLELLTLLWLLWLLWSTLEHSGMQARTRHATAELLLGKILVCWFNHTQAGHSYTGEEDERVTGAWLEATQTASTIQRHKNKPYTGLGTGKEKKGMDDSPEEQQQAQDSVTQN
ncbi:hypothetical protein BT96DRAFT_942332 [Gymnopus androsaceus JB14]|uniref:Uncharacterized protein n=1 Tax=Gymnopus androsaceus JB14 TaxID=1447944 RepID=A0A6A4HD30_9AGAR|nr:hypothetical protein BT96DRAFT_942332 [Gymnopus androsaceus JB14]